MKSKIKYPKLLLYSLGVVLLWVIIYQFTWSNTFSMQAELNAIEEELAQFESNKQNFQNLDLMDLPDKVGNDSLDFQHEVLAIVTEVINGKKSQIHQFAQMQKVSTDQVEVQIQPITLQGDFFSLLKSLNTLEQDYPYLNIASANFYVEKNRKTKRDELFLKMYVQKLI